LTVAGGGATALADSRQPAENATAMARSTNAGRERDRVTRGSRRDVIRAMTEIYPTLMALLRESYGSSHVNVGSRPRAT